MKRLLSLTLSAGVVLAAAAACRADEEFRPIAAVFVSSTDNGVNKLNTVSQLANSPALTRLGDGLKAMTSALGIDATAPCGEFFTSDKEGQLVLCDFLPISNVQAFVEAVKKVPTTESIELNDGVYEGRTKDGGEFFIQQKGKWVYRASNRDVLGSVPADPVKLLGDLPKRFDAAAKLFPKNVTVEFCQKLLDRCEKLGKPPEDGAGVEHPSPLAPAIAAARPMLPALKLMLPALVAKINEAEDAFVGVKIDPSTNQLRIDAEITASNGTSLAEKFALVRPGQSKFAGFLLPEAALSANWVRGLADDEVALIKGALALVRPRVATELENSDLSEDQVKLVQRWLDEVVGVFEETADNRQLDGGVAVLLEPAGAAVVAGAAVADGAKLEKVLKQFVEEAKKTDPDVAKLIKLNAEKHEGVRFHKVSMPTPQPELVPLLGETLEIVLGIDDDKFYLAAGHDAAKALKKVISQSKAAAGKEVPSMQINVSAAPILKFVAAAARDNMLVQMIVGGLVKTVDGAPGKDHVIITAKTIYRGVRYRIEIEEGLLKLLGSVSPPAIGGPPPGGMPPGGMPPGGMPPGGMPPGGAPPGGPPSVEPPVVEAPPSESPSPKPEPPPSDDPPDN